MDAPRFDRITRMIAARLTRRMGLGVLAGASLPLLGLAEATDAKKKKITLCFNGKTIKKPKKQAKKLRKQGATKGACVNGCGSNQKPCNNSCIPAGDCCVTSDCTGDDVCESGECAPLRCGNGGPCTVFVTNDGFKGKLGGLAGADAKCQAAAGASTENLTGTYKAWLSAGSETPGTRFSNIAKAGPYRLVPNASDGGNPSPLVATDFADLLSCDATCLQSAINRNQDGQLQIGVSGVWTGTLADGTVAPDTCLEWTSDDINVLGMSGIVANEALWTAAEARECFLTFELYCFQQAT